MSGRSGFTAKGGRPWCSDMVRLGSSFRIPAMPGHAMFPSAPLRPLRMKAFDGSTGKLHCLGFH